MSPDDRTWCEPYECSQSARSCARMYDAAQAAMVGRGPDATRRNTACETCADGRARSRALALVQLSARDRRRPTWRRSGPPAVEAYVPRSGQP